jgi:hypothetical protein
VQGVREAQPDRGGDVGPTPRRRSGDGDGDRERTRTKDGIRTRQHRSAQDQHGGCGPLKLHISEDRGDDEQGHQAVGGR